MVRRVDGRMQFAHSVSCEDMNVTEQFDLRVHVVAYAAYE